MNQVKLAGNLGKDPEIRTFEKGGKLATFSLATTEEFYTKSGDKSSSTTWHNISAWGKVADRIEAELKKGSFAAVEGRLTNRSYVDKNGQKRYVTEVIANDIETSRAA